MNETFKDWMVVQESFRRIQHQKVLKESYEPQTGIYYWIPLPKNKGKEIYWDIFKYFDSEYTNLMHDNIWKTQISSFLINSWKDYRTFNLKTIHEFKNSYAGLPRGRITRGEKGYFILHGDDSPAGKNNNKIIAREFGLPQNQVIALKDDHERMLKEDEKTVQLALKFEPM